MKILNKEQMVDVSGAGVSTSDFDFNSYEQFHDYLNFMKSLHLDPLYTPEAKDAYLSWCAKNNLDAKASASINNWEL